MNNNGLIDLPNTYTYAHPTSLDVTFTITNDATANSTTVYKWYVNTPVTDAEVAETGWSAGPGVLDLPISPDFTGEYETPYTVTCERRSAGVVDSFDVKSVTLRDILIVSMGDSYSSGEGNPEVNAVWAPPTLVPPPLVPIPQLVAPAQWADGADGYYGATPYGVSMTYENQEAHRSTKAATAQYALQLEQADPHISVTYVCVSESGATIANLINTPKPGILDPLGLPNPVYDLPVVIQELSKSIGGRTSDQVVISIGGNDCGFSNIISTLAIPDPFTTTAQKEKAALAACNNGYKDLAERYGERKSALKEYCGRKLPKSGQIFITEYPDPGRTGPNSWGSIDLAPGLSISKNVAQTFITPDIVTPLNAAIGKAAETYGWTYVGGISAAFVGHAYSQPPPGVSYFVTLGQSWVDQADIVGTLHPNQAGHKDAIANILWSVASPAFGGTSSGLSSPASQSLSTNNSAMVASALADPPVSVPSSSQYSYSGVSNGMASGFYDSNPVGILNDYIAILDWRVLKKKRYDAVIA